MQYLKDTGFVIRRINFGEADRYVTLFTKNHGKLEVIAKGVRKITSRRSSHIELLNLINFQAIKSSKNYILTEVELIDSFEDWKKNLQNISMLFLMSELVEKLCPYGQQHEDIFNLMYRALHRIDSDEFRVNDANRSLTYFDPSVRHPERVSGSHNKAYVMNEISNDLQNENETLFDFQVELITRLGFWDQKKKFRDEQDLRNFIESILERKIKTKIYR